MVVLRRGEGDGEEGEGDERENGQVEEGGGGGETHFGECLECEDALWQMDVVGVWPRGLPVESNVPVTVSKRQL